MTEAARSPPEATLDWVEEALERQAGRLGLSFERVAALTGAAFAGAGDTASARLEPGDLPAHARGVRVGRYAIVLSLLPEAANEEGVSEAVRRVRNQCVVARSYLSSPAALDLHALVVGPRGSEGSDRWRALALLAERDDRVARKLVWLRPENAAADQQSFDDFTRRTFLARPWITDAIFSMAPLDNVSRAAAHGEIARDTAGEWVRLATDLELDPDTLVSGLIQAWRRRR